jgi:hypothetical protein
MKGNVMQQLENARKYSLFALLVGLASFAFVLFLQPMDPARFILSAFRLAPSPATVTLTTVSVFAFWTSIGVFFVGMIGAFGRRNIERCVQTIRLRG